MHIRAIIMREVVGGVEMCIRCIISLICMCTRPQSVYILRLKMELFSQSTITRLNISFRLMVYCTTHTSAIVKFYLVSPDSTRVEHRARLFYCGTDGGLAPPFFKHQYAPAADAFTLLKSAYHHPLASLLRWARCEYESLATGNDLG